MMVVMIAMMEMMFGKMDVISRIDKRLQTYTHKYTHVYTHTHSPTHTPPSQCVYRSRLMADTSPFLYFLSKRNRLFTKTLSEALSSGDRERQKSPSTPKWR